MDSKKHKPDALEKPRLRLLKAEAAAPSEKAPSTHKSRLAEELSDFADALDREIAAILAS